MTRRRNIFMNTCLNKTFPNSSNTIFFFSFCSSRERKSTVYWQNKHMQMCREWLAGVICLKTSCARVVRSAYKLRHEFQPHRVIDKLTRPLNFRLNFLRFLCSFNNRVYLLLPKVYQKYPTSWYSFWENGRFLFNFHV